MDSELRTYCAEQRSPGAYVPRRWHLPHQWRIGSGWPAHCQVDRPCRKGKADIGWQVAIAAPGGMEIRAESTSRADGSSQNTANTGPAGLGGRGRGDNG